MIITIRNPFVARLMARSRTSDRANALFWVVIGAGCSDQDLGSQTRDALVMLPCSRYKALLAADMVEGFPPQRLVAVEE